MPARFYMASFDRALVYYYIRDSYVVNVDVNLASPCDCAFDDCYFLLHYLFLSGIYAIRTQIDIPLPLRQSQPLSGSITVVVSILCIAGLNPDGTMYFSGWHLQQTQQRPELNCVFDADTPQPRLHCPRRGQVTLAHSGGLSAQGRSQGSDQYNIHDDHPACHKPLPLRASDPPPLLPPRVHRRYLQGSRLPESVHLLH